MGSSVAYRRSRSVDGQIPHGATESIVLGQRTMVFELEEVRRQLAGFKPEPAEEFVGLVNSIFMGTIHTRWRADTENILNGFDRELSSKLERKEYEEVHGELRRLVGSLDTHRDRITRSNNGSGSKVSDPLYDVTFDKMVRALPYLRRKVIEVGEKHSCPDAAESTSRKLEELGDTLLQMKGDGARKLAAVVLGNWFSGSRRSHINGGTDEYVAQYFMNHHDNPVATMFIAVTKLGPEASPRNGPDISELMLYERLAAAGFKKVVLLDEFPTVQGNVNLFDNNRYVDELRQMMKGRIEVEVVRFPEINTEKFGGVSKAVDGYVHGRTTWEEFGAQLKAMSDRPGAAAEQLASDIWFSFQNNLRAVVRYAGSFGGRDAVQAAISATAMSVSKVSPGPGYHDDKLYISVTSKHGRLQMGSGDALLPNHGTAVIYPGKEGYAFAVAPLSDLVQMEGELSKHYDIIRLEEKEGGNYMGYALVGKGNEFGKADLSQALLKSIRQKANAGQSCVGLLNVLIRMGAPNSLVESYLMRKGIYTDSVETAAGVAAKLVKGNIDVDAVAIGVIKSDANPMAVADRLRVMAESDSTIDGNLAGFRKLVAKIYQGIGTNSSVIINAAEDVGTKELLRD